jgi:hypothetical protein
MRQVLFPAIYYLQLLSGHRQMVASYYRLF